MIGKSHFRVLSLLVDLGGQEPRISTLADRLGWSDGHASRVVSELERRGFVRTKESGREKLVTLADIEPVEQLETLLSEYGHVDFPELVAGSGLHLLYYLDRPRTATELANASGLGRATVYRRLDELQNVGVVGKTKSDYQLNDPFTTLSSIARGLAHHEHRREAERYAPSARILWETHEAYLFACDREIDADEFELTGPARFAEFEIPLMTRSRQHYFRSEKSDSLTPADLVCHTLLIDDGARYRTYSLLLLYGEGTDRETLQARAEYYDREADIDLVAIVDGLQTYLETEGAVTTDRLPSWKEFKQTAADYELNV